MERLVKMVMFCGVVLVLMAGQGDAAVKKTALVIGNGGYKNVVPLKNPVNDARDMKAALEKIGFEVIVRVDADRSQIREAVRAFGDKIKRGGVGLFYYAGHGIQVDGVNYIIPIGVDIKRTYDVEDQALRMNYVLGAMEEANNQLNIVILDACRDNPFRSISSFRGESAGLARMDAPTGTIVAYATAPGQKAEDGRGRNGTYTASLLKHLTLPDLSVQDMLNNTGLEVMKQTRNAQVPWISATPVPRFFLAGNLQDYQASQEPQTQVALPSVPQKTRLYVVTDPKGGQVRFMNINDQYYDGIPLDKGRYKIEASLSGYRAKTQWITVEQYGVMDVTIHLKKEEVDMEQAARPETTEVKMPIPLATRPMSKTASPIPVEAGQLWVGDYFCRQGITELELTIKSVNDTSGVQAIFDFDYSGFTGAFFLHGQYDPETRSLHLKPGKWIRNPAGYNSVGMKGTISTDSRFYKGSITYPGCGRFNLTLKDQ